MHKLMLMSATYQQSTNALPTSQKHDPDNHLFSRMSRLRLEGEIIRDSLLAISGRLNPKAGGPGETVSTRRSIYLFVRRNLRNPFLEAFDLPDSNLSCSKRERSTTAPQALALLNQTDVVVAAERLAILVKSELDPVEAIYRKVLGRKPSQAESKTAKEFLSGSPLSELCRALFNVNEFVYLD